MADIYVDAEVAPEADELYDGAVTYIQDNGFPDWQPDLFTRVFLMAIAQMVSIIAAIAAVVPEAIFRWFGTLAGIPPLEATQASVTATITVKDNLGYQVDDGTVFGLVSGGLDAVPFATVGDLVIPPGSVAGDVLLVAINPGLEGSGLDTVDLTKGDSISFITAVALIGVTQGGQDEEQTSVYLNRLARRLQLMAPRPILPPDFAEIVREDIPGIYRAVGLNGYNPGDNTWNNVRTVSVAVMSSDGSNVAAGTKLLGETHLEEQRELNFLTHLIDPTRTGIDIEYTGTTYSGEDIADVKARINAALADYLAPLTWGSRVGEGENPTWDNKTQVKYLEVATVIENVDGFDSLDDLKIGVAGGARAKVDINLPGAAPVPNLNAVIGGGTVNAP